MSLGNPFGSQNISTASYTKNSYPNNSGGKLQNFVSLGIKQLTTNTPPTQNFWATQSYTYNSVKYTSLYPAPSNTYNLYIQKNLFVDGTIYGTVVAPSDIKLKDNIPADYVYKFLKF